MFNNPYFNPYGQALNPALPPQDKPQQTPIQNIINTQPTQSNSFMAKFVTEGENIAVEGVYHKTAFIDVQNKKLTIKDVNGDIIEYGLIPPMDPKDKKIQELEQNLAVKDEKMNSLENEINKLKELIANEQSNDGDDPTSEEISKSTRNSKKSSGK